MVISGRSKYQQSPPQKHDPTKISCNTFTISAKSKHGSMIKRHYQGCYSTQTDTITCTQAASIYANTHRHVYTPSIHTTHRQVHHRQVPHTGTQASIYTTHRQAYTRTHHSTNLEGCPVQWCSYTHTHRRQVNVHMHTDKYTHHSTNLEGCPVQWCSSKPIPDLHTTSTKTR